MANNTFIPSTKEYQVLRKKFASLFHTITDPMTLAVELYSAGLISESARMKATTESNTRTAKSYCLLDELMIVVAKDCTNLMKIISVLQCFPPLLSAIAEDMKTECESSVTATIQPIDQQHRNSIVTVGESAYNDLTIMQMKLGGLVLKIQKEVKSAGIKFDDLKQLLILSYPFEKDIQEAETFASVFVAVRKHCSPLNIEILEEIVSHFELSDALTVIQEYEVEKDNYRKELLSATFTQELKKEAELIGRSPTPDCTIALKLNWTIFEHPTVKEFERVIKNLFLDYSKYIHACKVDEGCIFVTMCAPKPLMGAIVEMAKTRLPYLLDIGGTLLQIGDEIIIDKSMKEVIHTEVYQDQPLPVDTSIISTISQTESLPLSTTKKQEIEKLKELALKTQDCTALGDSISTILLAEVKKASYVKHKYGSDTTEVSSMEPQWKFYYEENDVVVLKKKIPNTKFRCFMGRGIIDAPIDQVAAYIKNFKAIEDRDKNLVELKICKKYSEHDWLLYMAQKATAFFFTICRGFLYYCRTGYMGDKYVQADVSVEHKDYPHDPQYKRAEILPGTGWVVEKHEGSDRITLVSYLAHLDLKAGNSKPVKKALRQQPMAIHFIRTWIRQSTEAAFIQETLTPKNITPSTIGLPQEVPRDESVVNREVLVSTDQGLKKTPTMPNPAEATPSTNITDTPGSTSHISELVSSDQGLEETQTRSSPEEEVTPSINEHIAQQQQHQELSELEKDVTDKQGDEEVRALKKEIEELRSQLEIQQNSSRQLTIKQESSVEQKEDITDAPGSTSTRVISKPVSSDQGLEETQTRPSPEETTQQKEVTDILKMIPDTSLLCSLLENINDKWNEIGIALGVQENVLSGLRKKTEESNTVKLSEVFNSWITTESTSLVTYEAVISAIEGPVVKNKKRATEIREYLIAHYTEEN